jgi:hypothetical protein
MGGRAVVRRWARYLLADRAAVLAERVTHQAAGAYVTGKHHKFSMELGDRAVDIGIRTSRSARTTSAWWSWSGTAPTS